MIDRQGRIADQPLTFHAKVKSSGYGQPIPQKMAPRKPGKIALPLTLRSHTAPKPGTAVYYITTLHRIAKHNPLTPFFSTLLLPHSLSSHLLSPPLLSSSLLPSLLPSSLPLFASHLAPSRRPQPLSSGGTRLRSYPQDCYPMTLLQTHNEYHANTPVFRLSYAPDASQVHHPHQA